MKYLQTFETRHRKSRKGDPDKRPTHMPLEGNYVILSDGSTGKIISYNKGDKHQYVIRIISGPNFNPKNGNQNVHIYDRDDIKFFTWDKDELETGKETIKYNI